ncbi:MAG: hypothetical protein K2J82_05580 [Muribaculaceae bacterium]|nr:hypothetical protein [Muribaculaceae bacterium]
MIKDPKRLTICFFLSVFILTVICCDRHSEVWYKLDLAENMMDSRPDSALAILSSLQSVNLRNEEEKARYALLMSMALDKNYIDTTTFDVLQPAIDYYFKHGSPNEKIRTFYYQGRIFQNKGDNEAAMCAFINGYELRNSVSDSLLLAHTLIAQGTLYFKQYKITEFIRNNLEAAKLYEALGRTVQEIKSYTNAVDGYIILNNKSAADSLLSLCLTLVRNKPDGETYLFPAVLSYTVEFGSNDEIKAFLDEYENLELTKEEKMNIAYGYSKIGESTKALNLIDKIEPSSDCLDSLKYISVKIDIFEKQGNYEQALNLFRIYSEKLERYQNQLLSKDLLFAEKKHELEMKRLKDIQDRNRIIWGTLCSIFGLIIVVVWLSFREYRSKTKRILTEKENENLKLEQENLRNEKEKAELERDKKRLEAENLEKDKKRLESEQREQELITANLKLEIAQLENERDNLKELQKDQSELAQPIQTVILDRMKLLNGLLAKEITRNESYAKPYEKWIEAIHNDRNKFMNSTRLAFAASHPKFMEYLEQHGLSTDEINYLCLYAIGLRGKEVGEYIQIKRHYIISHEIRKKLGINEHDTNIGPYIRRIIKEFEK